MSQMDLVQAIMKEIARQNKKTALNVRQFNAVIDAANRVVDALAAPHRPAVPGSGIAAWLASDETGASSLFMASVLLPGTTPRRECRHPLDLSDFRRCVGLVRAVPELRGRVAEMSPLSREWAAVATHWDVWESLLDQGKGEDLYEAMKRAFAGQT